jgi:hypothetical protein
MINSHKGCAEQVMIDYHATREPEKNIDEMSPEEMRAMLYKLKSENKIQLTL